MIVPMANNADFRTAQNGSYRIFPFELATVSFDSPTASNPIGIVISAPISTPISNPLDHFHRHLQIKTLQHAVGRYYGGYLFRRSTRGKFYILTDRGLVTTSIPGVVTITVTSGMIVMKQKDNRITFLSPASLGYITVLESQLPKPDRKYLQSVLPKPASD